MPELILTIGLPASGKSTFVRAYFPEHMLVSRDLFPNARRPKARQARELAAAFSHGANVVLDNTSVSRDDRALAFDAVRASTISRRASRSASPETRSASLQNASDIAIFDAAARLERPTLAESP